MPLTSHNPATGQNLKTYLEISDAELENKIAKSATAFESWRQTSFEERARILLAAQAELTNHAEYYGKIITTEMGKPITEAINESKKSGLNCEYYAKNGADFLTPEKIASEYAESYLRFDPLGAILFVMPWNFPFWQVFRMAAPTLIAGNTILLKHASNVPGCALACEKVWRKAGLPDGVFQTLLVGTDKVEKILRDDRVKGVSLTGSERAGSAVAKIAGAEIKPAVMELGGSDPFIVCADANLNLALNAARATRLLNAGQVCLAGKRFLVAEKIYDEFCARLTKLFAEYKIGDPMNMDTQMGPLVSERARTEIDRQVKESIKLGAKILIGGSPLSGPGYFYPPTILSELTANMPAWQEETFGPVAAIMKFSTDDEAIKIANDSRYGLSGAVFTASPERAQKFISKLQVGGIYVNDFFKSDPRFPIGGTKKSGLGRELAKYGIRAFVNVKTVMVK
ncbi:MAG: succinate-semialdehyde dehydrogenase [Candidatus Magasanikbacteria bacterium RIFOXYC2_FULL_42_28]|uniref:Succinate-semialdehyde dehydrogenase n=1 Tax=Candidatus Magasanikbacteria bacterium RIFOXYC2_FULL_42_28 TaxID=1798704 RepID=A0A1F6NXG9_9BACT|nr:MAG: succinate-semialdehyde dehydrogenase [Candidatus Magasanikbacteria bacterium RIFOXYC2_FULL_42_28]